MMASCSVLAQLQDGEKHKKGQKRYGLLPSTATHCNCGDLCGRNTIPLSEETQVLYTTATSWHMVKRIT